MANPRDENHQQERYEPRPAILLNHPELAHQFTRGVREDGLLFVGEAEALNVQPIQAHMFKKHKTVDGSTEISLDVD